MDELIQINDLLKQARRIAEGHKQLDLVTYLIQNVLDETADIERRRRTLSNDFRKAAI